MEASNFRTINVLKKFDDALKCEICHETSAKPFTTGSCSHFFCQACLLELAESICPKCSQPFYPGDITPDTTVGSILHEINKIAKIFKSSSRSSSNSLLNDVLNDIENGENNAEDKPNKIDVKKDKKGSIYTKNYSKPSRSVQNKSSKSNVSATERSKDVNENSPVFENNETESVDMIGNSQSPVKKTPLCFAKQKTVRHTSNSAKKERNSESNGSSEELVKKDDRSPYRSSDNESDFNGFPGEHVKNSEPVDKSVKMKRKPSNGKLDESKTKGGRKLKRDWVNKMSEDDSKEKPDESLVSSDGKLRVKSERIKRRSSLNEIDNAKNIDENLKNITDNEGIKNSLNDSSSNIKRKANQLLRNANSNVSKLNEGQKKSTSLIKARKNYDKEPGTFTQFEDDSSEIIPATPQDAAAVKMVDPISARGKRQKQDGGSKSLNTSLNVNITKRRDSVKRNKKGETPLHAACVKANVAEVERLLKEGADPNTKDYAGWTPLHEAVVKGNVQIVEALVRAGANINTPGHLNTTPLLEAVLQDNYIVVSFLLRSGADKSLKSRYNYRPLDCAQNDEMLKLLNQVLPLEGMTNKEASTNYCMPDPFCMCPISLNAQQSQALRDFCIKFELKCVESLRPEVTHAIVATQESNVCKCDVNVFKCLSNGVAVISFNWIEHSLKSNELTKPDVWEVHGTEDFPISEAFMKSRINAQKLLPKLFDGLHVSLTSNWTVWKGMTKTDIMEVVRDAGAIILNREPDPESIPLDEKTVMFHANSDGPMGICSHVTLYVPGVKEPQLKYNMKHLKTLSVKWVADCLQTFSIIDPL